MKSLLEECENTVQTTGATHSGRQSSKQKQIRFLLFMPNLSKKRMTALRQSVAETVADTTADCPLPEKTKGLSFFRS
jgi:hypothetical protein